MRLLNSSTYDLRDFADGERPPYAILSHRWFGDEITFANRGGIDLKDDGASSPSLEKIRGACRSASKNDLEWVWIDSYCIERASPDELSRSLNSMYEWYKDAVICLVYLSDVEKGAKDDRCIFTRISTGAESEQASEWFERGFTLQELLAPQRLEFYDRDWTLLGSRTDLTPDIERVTGIPAKFIDGNEPLSNASLAQKLSWQSRRRTTYEEDIVYSLLGILQVNLTPAYGEGRQAFTRLQDKLIGTNMDESLLAWTTPSDPSSTSAQEIAAKSDQWGLLAPWVDCFESSGDITIRTDVPQRPWKADYRAAKGISVPIPIGDLFNGFEVMEPPVDDDDLCGAGLEALCCICFPLPYMCWKLMQDDTTEEDRRYPTITSFPLTLNCYRNDALLSIAVCRALPNSSFWRRHACARIGQRVGRQVATVDELSVWTRYKSKMQMKIYERSNWSSITVLYPDQSPLPGAAVPPRIMPPQTQLQIK